MTTIRITTMVVIPYQNGRYVTHLPGDVISISALSESLRRVLSERPASLGGVMEPI